MCEFVADPQAAQWIFLDLVIGSGWRSTRSAISAGLKATGRSLSPKSPGLPVATCYPTRSAPENPSQYHQRGVAESSQAATGKPLAALIVFSRSLHKRPVSRSGCVASLFFGYLGQQLVDYLRDVDLHEPAK